MILFTAVFIQTNQKQRVTQYQIKDWNSDGHAKNSQNIITVMEEMYKVQRKAGSSSILVHCRLVIDILSL